MRGSVWWIAAMLLAALPGLSGCANAGGPWVELRGTRFVVEVADDDAERARGLMFRDSMPRDHGMLFVFEKQEPLAFWMKNTRLPLDILYFDKQRKLVSSVAAPPCTTPQCPSYPSAKPGRFVLELNAGVAREIGAVAGDEITFSPDINARLDSR